MRADVYWNLHEDCYSIRVKGKVVQHARQLIVENPTFVVQPAGRKRVLETRRKNVHAFVRGDVTVVRHQPRRPAGSVSVTYNPYESDAFVRRDDGSKIGEASQAVLRTERGRPRIYAVERR